MWKGTPVVAGRTGGIPLQMADGVGGILVDSVDECAKAVRELLQNKERASALGESGRDRVRERFLIPRLILDELTVMASLQGSSPVVREPDWLRQHDPVCGMTLAERPSATTHYRGNQYGFCSAHCRLRFLETPERYAGRLER